MFLNQVFLDNIETKTILKKEDVGQNCLKKLSTFQIFQLNNFTLTQSNKRNVNGVPSDMIYLKVIQQNEKIGQ